MPGSERQPQEVHFVLECVECGARAERRVGWRAYLERDHEVYVYCEDCAERASGAE